MVIKHEFYMSLALKEAWKRQGLTYPNPVVGALILDKHGKILSIAATQEAGKEHAELKAIEEALIMIGDTHIASLETASQKHAYILAHHDKRLEGASIYVTLEPCTHHGRTPPCSMLIKACGFKTLICGTIDPNHEASGGIQALQSSGLTVITDIMKEACERLLTPFKSWQANRPFVFFKIALSANGVYDGGTITSLESRTLVHALRHNIDLLVIGGETVRADRPTLDSRLVGGKAPDVLILSRQKDFDQSIPLFSVSGRKVFIEENFDKIEQYRFIMIEGTQSLLQLCGALVDWYCVFSSSSYKKGKTIQMDKDFKRLHCLHNKQDTITWYKGL